LALISIGRCVFCPRSGLGISGFRSFHDSRRWESVMDDDALGLHSMRAQSGLSSRQQELPPWSESMCIVPLTTVKASNDLLSVRDHATSPSVAFDPEDFASFPLKSQTDGIGRTTSGTRSCALKVLIPHLFGGP
jgi:hypothetical protein